MLDNNIGELLFLPCYRLVFVGSVITVEDAGWLGLDQHASCCGLRCRCCRRHCASVSVVIIFDELEITLYCVRRVLKRQVFVICWRQTNVGKTHKSSDCHCGKYHKTFSDHRVRDIWHSVLFTLGVCWQIKIPIKLSQRSNKNVSRRRHSSLAVKH